MQSNWAAEHLLVIRTLMERSAIYRRALAPIVLSLGVLGLAGAGIGWALGVDTPRFFVGFWSTVGIIGVSGAYLLARQQALKAAEPFWSAPTRRVTQALLPTFFAGFAANSVTVLCLTNESSAVVWLMPVWMVLYGSALHAAGFFMPRGMKLFGWIFVVLGCLLALKTGLGGASKSMLQGHWIMGGSFGGLHLAYGVYLHFTESRKNEP